MSDSGRLVVSAGERTREEGADLHVDDDITITATYKFEDTNLGNAATNKWGIAKGSSDPLCEMKAWLEEKVEGTCLILDRDNNKIPTKGLILKKISVRKKKLSYKWIWHTVIDQVPPGNYVAKVTISETSVVSSRTSSGGSMPSETETALYQNPEAEPGVEFHSVQKLAGGDPEEF